MYDVIIIGARCAGAPTAMLLARRGYRVLLLDQATFPSDSPNGHFIHQQGPHRLHRFGLLDRLLATGCPPITTMISDYGDGPLIGRELQVNGIALAYAPRRSVLDDLLVRAAVEAGVELREGFVVESITMEDGRVTGISGRDRRGGAKVTESARITVGADGRHSLLAKAVAAPMYQTAPVMTCWYFSYFSGVVAEGVEVYLRPATAIFTFPTHDELLSVFTCWPHAMFPRVRANIEGSVMAALDQVPQLAQRVLRGRRVERFYGASDVPNFYRKPYGPGWALVGDAGYHKDPFLALGIADAWRDVELLVPALDSVLSDRASFSIALAEYERQRNEASRADFQLNLHLAKFQPMPDEILRLRAAVRGDAEATRRFMLAAEGLIPPEPVRQSVEPRAPHRSLKLLPTHVTDDARTSRAALCAEAH